jgi:linoleoyl-CoA desaturase
LAQRRSVFYLLALFGDMSVTATLLCAGLFGVSSLLFAMNIGHEAAYGTMARGKLINRVIHFLASAPLGIDAELWKLRHVKSHHFSPNMRDYEVDSA